MLKRFCTFVGGVIGALAAGMEYSACCHIHPCTGEHLLRMLSAFGDWEQRYAIISAFLKKLRIREGTRLPINVEVLEWGPHDTLVIYVVFKFLSL